MSETQGRRIGSTHYLLGGVITKHPCRPCYRGYRGFEKAGGDVYYEAFNLSAGYGLEVFAYEVYVPVMNVACILVNDAERLTNKSSEVAAGYPAVE